MTRTLRILCLTAGAVALWPAAQARVVAPPMTASLVAVCQGQPCVRTPPPAVVDQARSRKLLTRRST